MNVSRTLYVSATSSPVVLAALLCHAALGVDDWHVMQDALRGDGIGGRLSKPPLSIFMDSVIYCRYLILLQQQY